MRGLRKIEESLEKLIEELADHKNWNWTRMASERDAADAVLDLMAQLGIIWQEEHPLGGRVWIFNSRLFGRTDNITYNPRGRKTKIRYKDREGSEYHYRGGRFVRRRSAGRLKNAASRTRRNRTQAQI